MLKRSRFFLMVFVLPVLVGCESSGEGQSTAAVMGDGKPVDAIPSEPSQPNDIDKEKKKQPSVSAVSLDGAELILKGENLDDVSKLTMKTRNGEVAIVIQSKRKGELRGRPASPLALAAGVLYQLIVSSAKASDAIVPITISVTLPNLAVNASCEAGKKGLSFAGYTELTNANLGGLKGGNLKCEEAFPGSHWASVDEIMSLGSAYPWTHKVWVREMDFTAFGATDSICRRFSRGYPLAGQVQFCDMPDYKVMANAAYGAPILTENGDGQTSCCNALRALACVK